MTDELSHDDLQALWQSQTSGETQISLADIRDKATRFERIVARRNLREYVAAVVVVAAFAWIMWMERSSIIRAGAAIVIGGTIFIVYYLRSRGAASPMPADLGLKSALEFHRAELTRQRDLLRGVWWWYVLPILSGLLVMQIGLALAHPERLTRIIIYCVSVVALSAGVYYLNRRVAARIQQRIDRLGQSR